MGDEGTGRDVSGLGRDDGGWLRAAALSVPIGPAPRWLGSAAYKSYAVFRGGPWAAVGCREGSARAARRRRDHGIGAPLCNYLRFGLRPTEGDRRGPRDSR